MLYLHLKQKLKNHCLCLKVANHYWFEAPEPAEGCFNVFKLAEVTLKCLHVKCYFLRKAVCFALQYL